ncbi:MAG: carboxypeptidase-like regulatory domain-containing protein, partial [Bacteroidota bacterium]
LWMVNRNSMINYLKQGLYGIYGQVSDSLSKENIQAEVRIRNHDKLNSSVYSDPSSGKFYRFLKEGNYDLEIEADGYRIARVDNVDVNDNERLKLSVSLIPRDMIPPLNNIRVGPNPFNRKQPYLQN